MNRTKLEQDLKQRVADIVKSDYKSSVNKFAAEFGLRQTTLNGPDKRQWKNHRYDDIVHSASPPGHIRRMVASRNRRQNQ